MKLSIAPFLIAVSAILLPGCVSKADLTQSVPTTTPAILCADQADKRIRLVEPLGEEGEYLTLWAYPAEDEASIRYSPTDAKRVEIDGEVYVLAAYHGRVKLIRFADSKVIKDYADYGSCHSAEVLPDGLIVSVSSSDNMMRLHHSEDEYTDLPMPYGHGVTWDKQRDCLWVLGDCLYRFSYADETLTLERRYELPPSPTGHDLFPLRQEDKLLVSNNEALFLFDIESETFETISELDRVKSASQHADGSIWVSEPMHIEGAGNWRSNAIIPVLPKDHPGRHVISGARFYKARWWQEVNFSY